MARPVSDGAGPQHAGRRRLILLVIAIAQLMVVLDATVVNIALPSAQRALHFSAADRQWVVTAYALAFGSLLLAGGTPGSFRSRPASAPSACPWRPLAYCSVSCSVPGRHA
jgi:MFS family permease